MIAEINNSLFVFTIILISITCQNVPHHIHSEAALLIGDDNRVTHMIVFFIESTTDIYQLRPETLLQSLPSTLHGILKGDDALIFFTPQ